jgi:hypothetical protein
MISMIKRRKFGQIAIATTTVTLISNLAVKASAQRSSGLLYGLHISGGVQNSRFTNLNLTISALNLVTNQVVTRTSSVSLGASTDISSSKDYSLSRHRITGFSRLKNGEFIVSVTQTNRRGGESYLIGFNSEIGNQRVIKVSGLRPYQMLEDFVQTQDGSLVCLLALHQAPPFKLGLLDYTGTDSHVREKSSMLRLSQNFRYSNITVAPDGEIYAAAMGGEGTTKLVKLDITGQKIIDVVRLNINNKLMTNDVIDLAFSPAGQLFAVANHQRVKSLFIVNLRNGTMEPIRAFSGDKITFSQSSV